MAGVWVEIDCDGNCAEARRMERQLEDMEVMALQASLALETGDAERAAEILSALTDEHERARHAAEERRIRQLWDLWSSTIGPRQPFLEWAHTRRLKDPRS